MTKKLVSFDDQADPGEGLPAAVRSELNATYVTRVASASALTMATFPVGAMVSTQGFHAPGDGGAATYQVISTASESYDVAGNGCAFRPVIVGTIHPRQFGTVNDGTTLDNLPLQACYDYAADHNIGIIDGQGLTYTIGTVNPYDVDTRGWAHTGALMPAGRTLENATFRTANGSTNGTVPLSIDMSISMAPTYLRNIEIDGNRANLTIDTTNAKEDGGCHLIHLCRASLETIPVAERDFEPCGDVYLDNVRPSGNYSYGIRVDYLDCLLHIRDSAFDVHGIAIQDHVTKLVVEDTDISVTSVRPGMVRAAIQAEGQFGTDFFNSPYAGGKKLTVALRNVRHTTDNTGSLYKMHYLPMVGVEWASITMENCSSPNELVNIFATKEAPLTAGGPVVDSLVIDRCTSGQMLAIIAGGVDNQPQIGTMRVVNKPAGKQLTLTRTTIGRLEFASPDVNGDSLVIYTDTAATIGTLRITDAHGALGVSGFVRTPLVTIDLVDMVGGEITQAEAVTFEAIISEARIRDVTVHSPAAGLRRFLHPHAASVDVRMQNVLFTLAGNTGPIVNGPQAAGGVIHLNNVRHRSVGAINYNVANFPAGRIVQENVAPLIA